MNIITSNLIKIKSILSQNENWMIAHLTSEIQPLPTSPPTVGYHYKIYFQDGFDPGLDDYENDLQFRYEFIPVRGMQEAIQKIASFLSEQSSKKFGNEADSVYPLTEGAGGGSYPNPRRELPTSGNKNAAADDDDDLEEIIVWAACDIGWNNQFVTILNKTLAEMGSDIEVNDLYRYLGVVNQERVVQALKTALNSEFIYPEDPIAFGYALSQVVNGLL